LTQGYDSVAMDVDLEIGGNDQMFNMLCGRDLLKAMKNKDKFVITLKLLSDDQGKKMGKSEGNVVFLNAKPNDMYGKIMSWPDGVITLAFELGTTVPLPEIKKMAEDLKWAQVNPRDLKMKLAHEITKINYGAETAKAAQNNFVSTIQKKELPEVIETVFDTIFFQSENINGKSFDGYRKSFVYFLDELVRRGMFSSKSEAKRVIDEGGVKINGTVLKDVNKEFEIDSKGLTIQRGKKAFLKIIKK
jgi:tyrosyl-tRNA synthetase